MIHSEAIYRFADRQKWLLRHTYDGAWQRGVESYIPDADPTHSRSTLPPAMALTGLTSVARQMAKRQQPYQPPQHPHAVRRAVALTLAFKGVNKMVSELGALAGGASPHIISGGSDEALNQWADANAWRLDAGDSVAWAGEQAGFAEAANADGQLLYAWLSMGDNRVCGDCEVLQSFPAMPLGDWPTSPGAGDTECSVGCRCGWDTWAGPAPDQSLSPTQSDLVATLNDRQAQALADMLPDATYLEG